MQKFMSVPSSLILKMHTQTFEKEKEVGDGLVIGLELSGEEEDNKDRGFKKYIWSKVETCWLFKNCLQNS